MLYETLVKFASFLLEIDGRIGFNAYEETVIFFCDNLVSFSLMVDFLLSL